MKNHLSWIVVLGVLLVLVGCGGGASSSSVGSESQVGGENLSPLVSAGGEVNSGGGGGMIEDSSVCRYIDHESPQALRLTVDFVNGFSVGGSGDRSKRPRVAYVGDYDASQGALEAPTQMILQVYNDGKSAASFANVSGLVISFYYLSDIQNGLPAGIGVLDLSNALPGFTFAGPNVPVDGLMATFDDPDAYLDLSTGSGGILVGQICGVQVSANGQVREVSSNPIFLETIPGFGP